jgi:hypothetical protein
MPPFPPPETEESSLGLGGLIARLPSCALPRGPKVQRCRGPKIAESRTRNGNGTRSPASPLACLFFTADPRRFQRAVPHWQSPGQIVFVSQEPTSRPPNSLEQRGGLPILPTGRPLCTISRRRAAQWRAPTNGLVLKTKRPPNPETERKKSTGACFPKFPPPLAEETPQHLPLFNHLQRVCP